MAKRKKKADNGIIKNAVIDLIIGLILLILDKLID